MRDRLFIKVHHNFFEHPKTVELSDKAVRQLLNAWAFCARNLNDGELSEGQAKLLFTPKSLRELLDAPYIHKTHFGYQMHQFTEHQMSAADVSDLRAKRVAAGKQGGIAKANNVASAKGGAKQTASKPLPDLEVDVEVEGEAKKTSSKPSAPGAFESFWTIYPRKVGKDEALKAFDKAVKRAAVTVVIEGATRYANDPNLPDREFIPHPATWLNGGRWDDEPCPPKVSVMRQPTNQYSRAPGERKASY